jgi:hypothetical protein
MLPEARYKKVGYGVCSQCSTKPDGESFGIPMIITEASLGDIQQDCGAGLLNFSSPASSVHCDDQGAMEYDIMILNGNIQGFSKTASSKEEEHYHKTLPGLESKDEHKQSGSFAHEKRPLLSKKWLPFDANTETFESLRDYRTNSSSRDHADQDSVESFVEREPSVTQRLLQLLRTVSYRDITLWLAFWVCLASFVGLLILRLV